MIHQTVVQSGWKFFTSCGIQLSEHDTDLTYDERPIETTTFPNRVTCPDCIAGRMRTLTKLRVVK